MRWSSIDCLIPGCLQDKENNIDISFWVFKMHLFLISTFVCQDVAKIIIYEIYSFNIKR